MDVFDYLSVENIVKKAKQRVKNLTNIVIRLVINYLKPHITQTIFVLTIKTNKPTSARGGHQTGFCYELPLFLSLRQLKLSSL